jgi:hypothetical protein
MKTFTPSAGWAQLIELAGASIRFIRGTTTRIRLVLAVLALGACLVSQADAQFGINVLNTQYTTYVMMQVTNDSGAESQLGDFQLWHWGNSRMTVSSTPISDAMYGLVTTTNINGQFPNVAQANTEMFSVSAFSANGQRLEDLATGAQNATAGAESQIWFSPLTSGTADIELDFSQNYEYDVQFYVSLINLTSGQTLWNYEWLTGTGTIPFELNSNGRTANLSLETDLNATDSYALDIFTQTFSDHDEELGSIEVSGLAAVPEPCPFALAGLAALLLTFRRVLRGSL